MPNSLINDPMLTLGSCASAGDATAPPRNATTTNAATRCLHQFAMSTIHLPRTQTRRFLLALIPDGSRGALPRRGRPRVAHAGNVLERPARGLLAEHEDDRNRRGQRHHVDPDRGVPARP